MGSQRYTAFNDCRNGDAFKNILKSIRNNLKDINLTEENIDCFIRNISNELVNIKNKQIEAHTINFMTSCNSIDDFSDCEKALQKCIYTPLSIQTILKRIKENIETPTNTVEEYNNMYRKLECLESFINRNGAKHEYINKIYDLIGLINKNIKDKNIKDENIKKKSPWKYDNDQLLRTYKEGSVNTSKTKNDTKRSVIDKEGSVNTSKKKIVTKRSVIAKGGSVNTSKTKPKQPSGGNASKAVRR